MLASRQVDTRTHRDCRDVTRKKKTDPIHHLPIDTVGVRLWKRESETVCWSAEVHFA